ncbi:MAG: hypothetical protein ACE5Q6_23700 [Dehalococcoidia bacterium]
MTATGVLILIASALRWVLGESARLDTRVFAWLSNIMLGLTLAYLYFLLVELITIGYSGALHEVRLTNALIQGPSQMVEVRGR